MNLPTDFIMKMKELLGDEYSSFENAFISQPNFVGMRITKPNAEGLIKNLIPDMKKIPWCSNAYYADKSIISGNHPYHIAGLLYFQEPSATAPVSALPVEHDDFVLDLCAAPGGKSTQVAEKLSENGLLIANEIIPKRAEILAENIERCGIDNAIVTNESPDRLAARFPDFFDKIIVDAPCSGEGMFRKEPQAIDEWSIAHTSSCAIRQQNILDCAISMLRAGGYLIYSTCTFSSIENEENISYILSEYPEMHLEEITLNGLSDGITPKNCNYDMSYTKRVFPHRADGEGHFMALLKKSGNASKRNISFHNSLPPQCFLDFEAEAMNKRHEGNYIAYGEHLYLSKIDINLDKLKVIRPGLHLGIIKKNRFIPDHALCLSSSPEDFKNTINLKADDPELLKYLHGEVIPCNCTGWVAVLCDGFPIGWGKASNGILKNHFPKKYRLK